MNYFKTQQHRNAAGSIEVTAVSQQAQASQEWQSRWDWKTLEAAQEVAEAASVFTGEDFIAVDKGECTFPRFDVIRAPAVGDAVSYSFNGDSYPCGYIQTVSKSLKKITTTSGKTFYRSKQTGCWLMNRTWAMVGGHIQEQNPHF